MESQNKFDLVTVINCIEPPIQHSSCARSLLFSAKENSSFILILRAAILNFEPTSLTKELN